MNRLMQRRRPLTAAQNGKSPYEHGTWEDLFWQIDHKKYKQAYVVGETLPLTVGTYGELMAQIVGFDLDRRAGEAGNAPVTIIAKYLLNAKVAYNPALAGESGNRVTGTGSIGGWEYSALRSWVQNTVSPLIPQAIAARIVPVIKYSKIANPDETYTNNATTVDRLWCPSMREVFYGASTTNETLGPQYSVYNNQTARVKLLPSGTAASYWLRSVVDLLANSIYVSGTGKTSTYGKSSQTLNVLIGFCVA